MPSRTSKTTTESATNAKKTTMKTSSTKTHDKNGCNKTNISLSQTQKIRDTKPKKTNSLEQLVKTKKHESASLSLVKVNHDTESKKDESSSLSSDEDEDKLVYDCNICGIEGRDDDLYSCPECGDSVCLDCMVGEPYTSGKYCCTECNDSENAESENSTDEKSDHEQQRDGEPSGCHVCEEEDEKLKPCGLCHKNACESCITFSEVLEEFVCDCCRSDEDSDSDDNCNVDEDDSE